MKKVLLFLAVVLGLASCSKPPVAPTIPSAQFEGTYVLDLKDVNHPKADGADLAV